MSVREKIVAAAFDRFHAKGFADCSVQDIVVAAGVPKGSFYNYFKSKELLAIEVVGLYLDVVLTGLKSAKGDTPLDRLKDYLHHIASTQEAREFSKGCMMGNFSVEVSDTTPRLRSALSDAFQKWNDEIEAVFKDAQKAGQVSRKCDVSQLARYFINSWEGALARMKVDKSRRSIDDFFGFFFESIR